MNDEAKPLFDRPALIRNRNRAARMITGADFLLSETEGSFEDRLAAVNRAFGSIAVIGGWDGRFARQVIARYAPAAPVQQVEFSPDMAALAETGAPDARTFIMDDDILPLEPESLDLILCPLVLQAVDDVPGALIQMRRALKPDGLFLGAMLCADSLIELRTAMAIGESETVDGISPRVAPVAELRDLGSLLQRAGFALPVTDRETLTVRYGAPLNLLKDLRAMGFANPLTERRRETLRKDTLARSVASLGERCDEDGKVPTTFDIAYLHGWAPHESQQRPLRPGSASQRLSDALGTAEQTLGETSAPDVDKRD